MNAIHGDIPKVETTKFEVLFWVSELTKREYIWVRSYVAKYTSTVSVLSWH